MFLLVYCLLTDDRLQGTQVLNTIRSDLTKANPKSGITQMSWNLTGSLLLLRFGGPQVSPNLIKYLSSLYPENAPHVVYLYDFPSSGEKFAPKLRTVLLHTQPVMRARWNPVRKGSLALCCGSQSLYIWSDEWQGESDGEEEMAECIGVPASAYSFAS